MLDPRSRGDDDLGAVIPAQAGIQWRSSANGNRCSRYFLASYRFAISGQFTTFHHAER
jgi:hypothetical protein